MIELLTAMAIMAAAVVTISLTFPKASVALLSSRQRYVARSFAASIMQDLKQRPYSLLIPNPSGDFGGVPNCDCAAVNMSAFPGTASVLIDGGVTYTGRSCIHLVEQNGNSWDSQCLDENNVSLTDKGLKRIVVRVGWRYGTHNYHTDLESIAARL